MTSRAMLRSETFRKSHPAERPQDPRQTRPARAAACAIRGGGEDFHESNLSALLPSNAGRVSGKPERL
eukprot:6446602-Pyramimonas_sp.AAC.1